MYQVGETLVVLACIFGFSIIFTRVLDSLVCIISERIFGADINIGGDWDSGYDDSCDAERTEAEEL